MRTFSIHKSRKSKSTFEPKGRGKKIAGPEQFFLAHRSRVRTRSSRRDPQEPTHLTHCGKFETFQRFQSPKETKVLRSSTILGIQLSSKMEPTAGQETMPLQLKRAFWRFEL
jgi:hypothetical protein